jgi:hypothetical protein
MKKLLSLILALVILMSAAAIIPVSADDLGSTPVYVMQSPALYAHASRGSKDTHGWVRWYGIDGTYYIFLPSSVKEGQPVELYSAYNEESTLGSLTIPANSIVDFTPDKDASYIFRHERTTRTVKFLYSTAEAALFVNNLDDFNGDDFLTYLQADKAHSVSASAAIAYPNGTISDVAVKKMKGRGNTSWEADKKGFNITFKEAVILPGMDACKKYSLVSNFQDASLARNRILFDLSDAVGVPYASDSRMIDLYTNGVYQGTYQMCQKIEVGKDSLIPDIAEDDYLAEDGGVKENFSFVAEIDASPAEDDFHFSVKNGNNLTIKSPALASDDPNLSAVRSYIKSRFNTMYAALSGNKANLDQYIDLDSLAKVYLINELGKNWDSGASSFFLTYKPDADGNYKFFASPVWDFDNSLGNANGSEGELRRMNCTDYTLPTGWFSTLKGGYNGANFLAAAAKHTEVKTAAVRAWFESFVPALEKAKGDGAGNLSPVDYYRDMLAGTAAMNYTIWKIFTNTTWIADHSSLQCYSAAYTCDSDGTIIDVTVTPCDSVTRYDQYTFDGQYQYMIDWLYSRAAWISSQYITRYTEPTPADPTDAPTEPPTEPPTTTPPTETDQNILGDVNLNGVLDIIDATYIQRHLAGLTTLSARQLALSDTNRSGGIDIIDATYIQRKLAGIISDF